MIGAAVNDGRGVAVGRRSPPAAELRRPANRVRGQAPPFGALLWRRNRGGIGASAHGVPAAAVVRRRGALSETRLRPRSGAAVRRVALGYNDKAFRIVCNRSASWKGLRIKPETSNAFMGGANVSWLYALVRITLVAG